MPLIMKNIYLTSTVRMLVLFCGLALFVVLYVPLWQIELAAPQYPEGLVLKMYPHKLAGNVDIINGLNHYIGMKTLHTEDFIEFSVLPYLIVFFAIFCLSVSSFLKTYKWLISVFILFVIFGVVAMVDFWRWEYQYGHDLDPNAAINVPGMSYQPPLIGYKQLLNFGAYSIPDIGGWIFIGVGMLLLTAIVLQYRINKKRIFTMEKGKAALAALFLVTLLVSCKTGPQPIKVGVDACSFCKMGIADQRFGAELITKKGKIYKFDDLHCLLEFKKSKTVKAEDMGSIFLVDYEKPHGFMAADQAYLLKSDALRSPMGGNIACFGDQMKLMEKAQTAKGEAVKWNTLIEEN